MSDITTVKIRRGTRDRLADLGSKRDTYDQIINRLIDFYNKNKRADS